MFFGTPWQHMVLPFVHDVGNALSNSLKKLAILKKENNSLFRCGLVCWNKGVDAKRFSNAKRWETISVSVSNEYRRYINDLKTKEGREPDTSYRPFPNVTTRYCLYPQKLGWNTIKKDIIAKHSGSFCPNINQRLAISSIYVYVTDGEPVGVGVFVQNMSRNLNVEIIFPIRTESIHRIQERYAQVYTSLEQRNYSNVERVASTEIDAELLEMNPMGYLEVKMMLAHSLSKLDQPERAIQICEDSLEKVQLNMQGFEGSNPAIRVMHMQTEARNLILPTPIGTCAVCISDGEECVICLQNVPDITTECNHHYCAHCCDQWFRERKKTCPICRSIVHFLYLADGNIFNIH
mgnify:CR=1 FL=1